MQIILEAAIASLYAIALYTRKAEERWMLLLGALFALVFENLNQVLFNGVGGYSYAPDLITIWRTPLYVILSWGIIIYSSYAIASGICRTKLQRIFLVPPLTVLIDFALDPIAVELGLWSWQERAGIFGVPAANFIGWYLVSLGFILFYELLEGIKPKIARFSLTVVFGYGFFLLASLLLMRLASVVGDISEALGLTVFFCFFVLVSSFTFASKKKRSDKPKRTQIIHAIILRAPYYLFALIAGISLGMPGAFLTFASCIFALEVVVGTAAISVSR